MADLVSSIISESVRKEINKANWWPEVQEDVKTRLIWIINNISTIGITFTKAYSALFALENIRRKLDKISITHPIANYIASALGMKISEESYQCGILPTRSVLDLYDYTYPNDADVTACMFLCNKIDFLHRTNLLEDKEIFLKPTNEEISAEIQKIAKKEHSNTDNINEKLIKWEFGN